MLVQFMCRSLPPLRIYFLVVNAYPHVSLCAYKTPPHMCVYVFLLRNGLFMSHIVLSVQLLVLLLLSTYFSIKLCFFSLSSCGRLYAGIFPYITADLVFGHFMLVMLYMIIMIGRRHNFAFWLSVMSYNLTPPDFFKEFYLINFTVHLTPLFFAEYASSIVGQKTFCETVSATYSKWGSCGITKQWKLETSCPDGGKNWKIVRSSGWGQLLRTIKMPLWSPEPS